MSKKRAHALSESKDDLDQDEEDEEEEEEEEEEGEEEGEEQQGRVVIWKRWWKALKKILRSRRILRKRPA